MYKNVAETVRYVRMANTSHTSGLWNCGQMSRQFGYGISQKNFHGRPRCRIGKSPAVMTANTVIASDAAVDRGAEPGAEQIENRRDQRAGVADTDPEHEGR